MALCIRHYYAGGVAAPLCGGSRVREETTTVEETRSPRAVFNAVTAAVARRNFDC